MSNVTRFVRIDNPRGGGQRRPYPDPRLHLRRRAGRRRADRELRELPELGRRWRGTYCHVPIWVGFKLDGAYVGGSDPECIQLPGAPFAGGNGGTGCLKGWFVAIYSAPGPIIVGPIQASSATVTGIVLVN